MNLCRSFFDRQELAYDAEDAVQETLMRLWKMRDRIGDYQKPEALAMLIAKNVCIDILKLSKEQHEALNKTANVILLGAAQKALGLDYATLENAIRSVFGRKGDAVVEANIKALALGKAAQK